MYIIRVLSVRVFSLVIRSVALCLSECIVCYALCAGGRMHFWRMDFIFEELQRKMFPWERSIKIKFTLAK